MSFSKIPVEVYANHFDILTRIKLMTVSKGIKKQFQRLYNHYHMIEYKKQMNNKRNLHVLYVYLNENFLKLYENLLLLRLFYIPYHGQIRLNISHRFLQKICRFSNVIPMFIGVILESINKYLKNCGDNIALIDNIMISNPFLNDGCKDISLTFIQINYYVELVSIYIKMTQWENNPLAYKLFIRKVLLVFCLIFNIMYLGKIQGWRNQFMNLDDDIQLEQQEFYLLSSRGSYPNLSEI